MIAPIRQAKNAPAPQRGPSHDPTATQAELTDIASPYSKLIQASGGISRAMASVVLAEKLTILQLSLGIQ